MSLAGIRVKRWKIAGKVLLALAPILALAPRVSAQAVAVAEVDGSVTDQTGQSIVNAQVKATEIETQLIHTATTNTQGRYQLPDLPIGAYVVEVTAPGFKAFRRTGITLQVAQNAEVNVQMEIGAVSESVEVKGNAEMVETKDNTIGQVMDQQRVEALPLNGRNPIQLVLLTQAASTTPAGDLTGSKNIQGTSGGSQTISVAGSQGNGLSYLLDGGDNNDSFSNVGLPLPFPDALGEFNVETSTLPAQYGLHPGGVVNAITKSGTNAFHGDLFEFLRNGDLNARQEGTLARDTLKRNQFGGTFGGPVIRNKIFFFGGYEGTQIRSQPPTSTSFVPTAAVLQGDFSAIDSKACVSKGAVTLKNPSTGTPFPNNQIPMSMFDPAAFKVLTNYIPTSTDPCGKIQYGLPANNPDNQWIGRVDYVASQKQQMYTRYYIYDYTGQVVFDGKNALTTTTAGNHDRSQAAVYGDTYTFSPTLLNTFHANFDRRRDDRGDAPNLFNPVSLGVNMYNPVSDYIQLTITNYFNVGCGTCAPGFFNQNTFQLADDLSWIRGKHQLAFGFDGRRLQLNNGNTQQANGQFTFSGGTTGDALADFLIGRMSQFVDGNPNPNAIRQTVIGAYAQDTFRATTHLTLNLGVRWEPAIPAFDEYNRGDQFSQALFNAGTHSTVFPNAPAGLLFAGDSLNKNGKYLEQHHWMDFSPRVGIVWDPTGSGKQTIRTGFALIHDNTELFYPERETTNPPYASSVTLTNPTSPFSNPWLGYPGGNPFPGAAIFPVGGTYVNIPPNVRPTYVMQWNLSYQRQFGKDWLGSINYLGNKTTHLLGSYDIDPSIPVAGSSAATNNRRLLYLQNPAQGQFYSNIQQSDDGGIAHYNAMILSVQHRFATHFTLLTNYVWSHCVSDTDFTGELAGPQYQDPFSRTLERGSCGFDRRSNFNATMVVTTPSVGNSFERALTGNWQLSPIFTAYSGQPFTITDGGKDISLSGQLLDRPNDVLPTQVYPATLSVKEFFNPAAFAVQPSGTFGNTGRFALVGPGLWNLDVALVRNFKITERFSLEARGEAFNIFNHGNWNAPTNSIASGTFGQVLSFSSPRIMQAALKVVF